MENGIGTIIESVIQWFVDIFTGVAGAFVNTNAETGAFESFTIWGNVLFIGVAVMLVMICLRWVISLVRRV